AQLLKNCPPQETNIFIGGAGDKTLSKQHPVEAYYLSNLNKLPNPQYFTYDAESAITDYINDYLRKFPENSRINLIGHSYGGDTAVNLAAKLGKKINLLITIDPVGGESDPTYPKT